MKVKNIMFSGVMGVILMSVASSANAAISVASKAYVDTKASNIETAYKDADEALDGKITAMDEAYKVADTALGARVTKNETDIATNAQAIAEVKVLTGTEGVADQIENALKVESDARAAAVSALQTKDTELAGDIAANATAIADEVTARTNADTALENAYKAADTTLDGKISANATAIANETTARESADTALAGDIDAVEAKFVDYTKTVDLDATFATNDELAGAVSDLEAADATNLATAKTYAEEKATAAETAAKTYADGLNAAATEAIAKKVDQTAYDAKVEALEAEDDVLAGAITSGDESTLSAAKTYADGLNTTATEAIAKKVDQSEYDAKVTEIEDALLTKIEMPAACATQDCVLAINKASGTISWTPLTEPVADFINQQN